MIIIVTCFTGSIGSSGRSIHQGHLVRGAIVPDLLRVVYIQMLVYRIIEFGGFGTGADMEYEINNRFGCFQPAEELLAFYFLPALFSFQIGPFVRYTEIIYQN